MIKIFIDTEDGTASGHYDFASVPNAGDVVFILTEDGEIKLRVKLVEHYVVGKGDVMHPVSPVTLQCERVEY
jgi:hypothetical protein